MTDKPKKKQGFAAHPELINRKGRLPTGTTVAELTRAFLAEEITLENKDKNTGQVTSSVTARREEFLRKNLFTLAMSSPEHGARIRATEAIFDRAYGKAPQEIKTTPTDNTIQVVDYSKLSTVELRRLIELFKRARVTPAGI